MCGCVDSFVLNLLIYAIMKIVKSFEECRLLVIGVREKIQNEAKKQKGGFLDRFLDTPLGNILASKGVVAAGAKVTRVGKDF